MTKNMVVVAAALVSADGKVLVAKVGASWVVYGISTGIRCELKDFLFCTVLLPGSRPDS